MVREETARALRHRLAVEQSTKRLPSVAASLVRDGRTAWFGSAGLVDGAPPTDETQYRCGSITKTFIAVEVMRLRDEGLLELTDPIGEHVEELKEFRCDIANLLSHTSGLRAETSGPWWERTPGSGFAELVASSCQSVDVLARASRRFHYSNVGFAILGEVISRCRKMAWDDVFDQDILRPLGMLRTSTRPIEPFAPGLGVHPHADVVMAEPEHDAGAMGPAGQLWTTTFDLSAWSSVLAGRRPEILSPKTAREMREPIAVVDVPEQPWTQAHGLGLQLSNEGGRRSYGHGGSMPGFLAALRIDEETGDAVVVLADATSGMQPSIERDLLAIFAELEPPEPTLWRPAVGGIERRLLELTGTWYWGTKGFVLSIGRDEKLHLHALDLGREGSFEPLDDDSFIGLSGYYEGETLRPVRRADGSLSHLDVGSFVFTRVAYDETAPVPGGVDARGWVGSPADGEGRHHILGHQRRRG